MEERQLLTLADSKAIMHRELRNDGSHVYLYFNPDLNAWIAYGLSAYFLRLFAKGHALKNCFRSWSEKLQLPYTIVDKDTFNMLLDRDTVENKADDSSIDIIVADAVDKDAYHRWMEKLRRQKCNSDDIAIETPVSNDVPKDRFIPDNMSSITRNIKRILDCLLAFIALLVFSPLILVIYIAVRMEDGGPAIFRQERIGRFGRPFYIYKFRSMRLDAEKKGPQLSTSGGDGDTRLTKVGRFIRAHHLDELPQLWNVFCGDMSFVGPRPERRFFIDQIVEYDPRYVYLYQIRPGVTSYATLYNGYTDTMEKMLMRLEYDLYYLGHRSLIFDTKVLLKTFLAIVFGKKF